MQSVDPLAADLVQNRLDFAVLFSLEKERIRNYRSEVMKL